MITVVKENTIDQQHSVNRNSGIQEGQEAEVRWKDREIESKNEGKQAGREYKEMLGWTDAHT